MAETREHILTVTRLSSKDIEQDRRKTPFSFYTKHPQALFKQALLWWGMNSPVCEASSNSRLIRSGQPLSPVWLFVTPWTPAHQASLSTMNSQSLLKLMFIESVMPSNHLNLYCPLLLSLSILPASGSFPMSQFFPSHGQSIRASASASVLPMNITDWFPLGLTGWISLLSKGFSRVFSNSRAQRHQFFRAQLSL